MFKQPSMKKIILQFQTMKDMLEFESAVKTYGQIKDHSMLTITGYFEDSAIKLAKTEYRVVITEQPLE
jgi:hypothetical protein